MRRPAPSYTLPPTHALFLLRQPLVGMPSLSPHLHVRVALHPLSPYSPSPFATAYDLLPLSATSASALLSMLAGRCVPAETRMRRVRWPVREGKGVRVRFVGQVRASEREVESWVRLYRGCECGQAEKGIELYRANCYRFAEEMVRKLRAGEFARE